jgi:MFS family permease
MRGPKLLSALESPRYRRIFAAQLVSQLGDWLDFVGLLTLVAYTWKGGVAGLAGVTIGQALVYLFVAPFTGVLADRLPRRLSMVGSDGIRAGVVLCYLLAPNIPVLLALMVVKVSFSTLFNAAESAAIRENVPEDSLLQANSLSELTTQVTKFVGPALGGLLVANFGVHTTFVGDSVSFLLSAAVLSTLRFAPAEEEESEPSTFRQDAREGLRFITARPALLLAIGSASAMLFLVFMFDTYTPLAVRQLGFQPSFLGYAYALSGLGTAIGLGIVGQWGDKLAPLRLMSISEVLAGLLVAVIGAILILKLHTPTPGLLVIMVAIGFCASGLLIAFPYILMAYTPAEMMGRVSAFAGVLPTSMQLIGPAVGAGLIGAFGVGSVFGFAGLLLAAAGCVVLLLPASARRPEEEATDSEEDATGHLAAGLTVEKAVVGERQHIPPELNA